MNKISVLLVDDHTIVRQGLRSLLEAEKEIEIIGEASKGSVALELVHSLKPSVVIMDISMPDMNGIHATERICNENPSAKVLVLSMYIEEEFIHQVIQAGAMGYLIKQTASTDLINAVKEIHNGNAFFSPAVSKIFILWYKRMMASNGGFHPSGLTSREFEIVRMIAQGKTSNEIAEFFFVSVKAVEKYRKQIMDKLDVHDVASLTKYAISRGFLVDILH
jgi:DNA-binding NarL/FixJ family response regulator